MKNEITYTFHPENSSTGATEQNSILLIYTGGTIGAVPSDRNDPSSPLKIADWEDFQRGVNEIDQMRKRGIRIDTIALDQPLDSTNVEPRHWTVFVDIIYKNYGNYMGFVILHGTDTMVFTASALSFMLIGLSKPVVVTGSQIPILDHPYTDGVRNLVGAISVAAWRITNLPCVPEVCIAFDKVLIRGNRARKYSADELEGFRSPDFPPLGYFEDRISIDSSLLWRPSSDFSPRRQLNPNVISLQIFPGIQNSEVLEHCFSSKALKAVVLQAYGTGNAPTSDEFLNPIAEAVSADKIIMDVTQCFSGDVKLGQYESGIGLLKRGVLSGFDITPEAALCKLMVLLGRDEMSGSVKTYLQRSLAGEQSANVYASEFTMEGGPWILREPGERLDLVQSKHDTNWDKSRISSAWLHLHNGTISSSSGQRSVRFEIYFNLDPDIEPSQNLKGFAGDVKKQTISEPSFISYDVTRGVAAQPPGHPPKITLVLRSEAHVTFTGATLLVFTDERTPKENNR